MERGVVEKDLDVVQGEDIWCLGRPYPKGLRNFWLVAKAIPVQTFFLTNVLPLSLVLDSIMLFRLSTASSAT